jgi:hypothetical protein
VSRKPAGDTATAGFTPLQGQYLAFIYAYTTIHRRPPAEADMRALLSGARVHLNVTEYT